MAVLRSFAVWSRIGSQADRTTKHDGSGWVDLALLTDGMALTPGKSIEALDTEHRTPGVLKRAVLSRNADEQNMTAPLFPSMMGTFINGVLNRDASGDLTFFSLEHYREATLQGTPDIGDDFLGIIMNGLSLTVDRDTQGNFLQMDFPSFINSKTFIPNGACPAFVAPPLDVYLSTDVIIDFVGDNGAGSFGGDNPDIVGLTVTFGNNTELSGFASSSVTKLDRSWTRAVPDSPTATIEVTLAYNDDEYVKFGDGSGITFGSLRLIGAHPQPTFTATSVDVLTATSSGDQTVTFTDTLTDLVDGDVVFIRDTDNGKDSAHTVKDIVVGVSFDINTDLSAGGKSLHVALDGFGEFQRQAAAER